MLDTGHARLPKKSYDCLPEQAKWIMHENHMKFHERKPLKIKEPKIYTGVNHLKNLGLARRFICSKYSISIEMLEILLFIYPYNYFTKKDYDKIANTYFGCRLHYLKKKGLVKVMYAKKTLKAPPGQKKQLADIYTLSKVSKNAVVHFHKIISGEREPSSYKSAMYSKDPDKNKLIKDLLGELNVNKIDSK